MDTILEVSVQAGRSARRAAPLTRLWPLLGLLLPLVGQARAAEQPPLRRPKAVVPATVSEAAGRQILSMEAGSGRVVTLPGPAANVFVADPKVAEVRPASTNSLFVFGVGPGRTTIAAMDNDGHAVSQIDVAVRPNTFAASEAEAMVARLVPNGRVRVTPQARGVMLTGSVESPADAARAVAIMRGFIPDGQNVENQLQVKASVQVNMRVRIVEMQRSVTRALGIDWQAMGSLGRFGVAFATANGLGLAGTAAGTLTAGTKDANALVDALATDNLVRILAEPNLTVMSGQPGSFLAGGEFPIPVAQQNNVTTVEFKKYGVNLSVVPTVLSDGRINLHIAPEVSQLSDAGAVRSSGLSVPSITVRRAETSVELGSGQSFAIAGLLQNTSTQSTTAPTFLGDLPIIGSLFRSSGFQKQETELVILVTPYVVRPVDDPARLHTAEDRYTPPNDFERILLNRQVGMPAAVVQARIPGASGFVVQ